MDGPKLIGIVTLKRPRVRRTNGGDQENIAQIAFDTDGQCWGLVTRLRERPDLGEGVGQLDHVRWVRFEAIPFTAELVTIDGWD